MKWNESGFRPPLCTYRLNWARRTSWGWWDDWDDTVLQTQDSKFEPWRSEAEHATSRSRRLPTILTFTRGWGRNNFVSFKPPRPGTEPRTLAWKAAVLTTTLGPPPNSPTELGIYLCDIHYLCDIYHVYVLVTLTNNYLLTYLLTYYQITHTCYKYILFIPLCFWWGSICFDNEHIDFRIHTIHQNNIEPALQAVGNSKATWFSSMCRDYWHILLNQIIIRLTYPLTLKARN